MRKKYAVYREVLWFFFRHENPTITYTQVYKLLLKPIRILSEGSLQSKISWFNFWFVTNSFSQMNARGDSSMLSSPHLSFKNILWEIKIL